MSDNEQDCMEDIFECTLPVPKSKQRGTLITTLPQGGSIWGDKTLNRQSPMVSIGNQIEIFQKQIAEAMSVNMRPSITIPTAPYSVGFSVSEKDLIIKGHTNSVSVGNSIINDDTQFSIVPSNIQSSSIVLETDAGKIQVNYDGSIEIEGNVHFDTVACKFWDAVSKNAPGNNSIIDRLKKENKELKDRISVLEPKEAPEDIIASIRKRQEEKSIGEIMSLIRQRKSEELSDNDDFEKAMELVE